MSGWPNCKKLPSDGAAMSPVSADLRFDSDNGRSKPRAAPEMISGTEGPGAI